MEDKKLTEKESLEIITSMIARTKALYIGDGNIMLMWGYLVVAVAFLVWALLAYTHNPAWNWLWFLIWIVGGTATPAMAKKQQQKHGVKSYSDKITSRIWSAVSYSAIISALCCLIMLLAKGLNAWSMMMFVFALIIVPFAEIAQGVVINEKSLIAGGGIGLAIGIFSACCVAGGVALYVNWYLPLFILAYVCMMIIPGHIINKKAKRK